MDEYTELNEIIETISKVKGLSKEEVLSLIKSKVEEFNGLIKETAAALMIAKELGVEIPRKRKDIISKSLKIKDLIQGLRNVTFVARVLNVIPSLGEDNKLKSLKIIVADDSGVIPVILWENDLDKVDINSLKIGSLVRICKGIVKKFANQLEVLLNEDGYIELLDETESSENIPPLSELIPEELRNHVIGKLLVLDVLTSSVYSRKFEKRRKVICIRGVDLKENKRVRIVAWGSLTDLFKDVKEGNILEVKYFIPRRTQQNFIEISITPYTIVNKIMEEFLNINNYVKEYESLNFESVDDELPSVNLRLILSYLEPSRFSVNMLIHDTTKCTFIKLKNSEVIASLINQLKNIGYFESLGVKLKIKDVDIVKSSRFNEKPYQLKVNPWSTIEVIQSLDIDEKSFERVFFIDQAIRFSTIKLTITGFDVSLSLYDRRDMLFFDIFSQAEENLKEKDMENIIIFPVMKLFADDGLKPIIILSNNWNFFEKITGIDMLMVKELINSPNLIKELLDYVSESLQGNEYLISGLVLKLNDITKVMIPTNISPVNIDSEINLLKGLL